MRSLPNPDESRQLSLWTEDTQLTSPFDTIRHFDEQNNECWYGRELGEKLGYDRWSNFKAVISKAKTALKKLGMNPADHIADVSNMITAGKGARRKIDDFKLSRFACYHIALAGDSTKFEVADAKTYFIVQTRKQELASARKPVPVKQSREFLRARHSGYNENQAIAAAGIREKLRKLQTEVNAVRFNRGADGKDFGKLNALDSEIATGKKPSQWKQERGISETPADTHSALQNALLYYVKREAVKLHIRNGSHGLTALTRDVRSLEEQVASTRETLQELLSDLPIELPAPKGKQLSLESGE